MQPNSKETSRMDQIIRRLPYALVALVGVGALMTRTPDPWIMVLILGMLVLGGVNFYSAWRAGKDFSVVDFTIDALRYIIIGLVLIKMNGGVPPSAPKKRV